VELGVALWRIVKDAICAGDMLVSPVSWTSSPPDRAKLALSWFQIVGQAYGMASLTHSPVDSQTRIRRLAQYQQTDRQALSNILDEAFVAHLAIVRDDIPVALPVGFARDGNSILIHRSTGSDFFRRIAAGTPVCVNITHLDGPYSPDPSSIAPCNTGPPSSTE
jgi:hypothetical protein